MMKLMPIQVTKIYKQQVNINNAIVLREAKIDEKKDIHDNKIYIIDKKHEYPSVSTILKSINILIKIKILIQKKANKK